MRFRLAALTLVLLSPALLLAQETLTQADLLRRLIDLNRLMTAPPPGETTQLFSSYDRRSRVDDQGRLVDWNANQDAGQFLRALDDGWQVMAELDGPGAITRIWSPNPRGELRILLDGQPVIETEFSRLFTGDVPPFKPPLVYVTPGGGHNCYFPIGFSQTCQVLVRRSASIYQVNTVSFPKSTRVATFSRDLNDEATLALDEATNAFLATTADLDDVARDFVMSLRDKQLFAETNLYPLSKHGAGLRNGDKISIETFSGGGIVRAILVAFAERTLPRVPYALHRSLIRVYIDDEKEPRVEAPLIDFFGAGFEMHRFNSLVSGTDKWTDMPGEIRNEGRFMYCYFPMPFADKARIELEINVREPQDLTLWARIDRNKPPADALRFNARFRKVDPVTTSDYTLLETSGPGRIVGWVLNVDTPRASWWGEGDHKVWLDSARFPAYFGTDSAGFLGAGLGFQPHSRPLQGVTRSGAYGKASGYRWLVGDCINFRRAARVTLGNVQESGRNDVYYSSVAFWYGAPDADSTFERLSEADLTPPGLRIPNAVEVEETLTGDDWGNLMQEKHAGGVELSGGAAAVVTTTEPLTASLHSTEPRMVHLRLRVHPRRPFGTIDVRNADGKEIGVVEYDRESGGIYDVGITRLQAGSNPLTIRLSKTAVLDCWILDPPPTLAHGAEGETLEIVDLGDGITTDLAYGDRRWSQAAARKLTFTRADQTATFAIPQSELEYARLHLIVGHGPDGGRFQTLWDGQPVGEPFDTRADREQLAGVALDVVQYEGSDHRLGLRAVELGANDTATLYLDALEPIPVLGPHAIDVETLRSARISDDPPANPGIQRVPGASGAAHVWCRAPAPGAWLEVGVPVQKQGRYRVSVVYTRSLDYGIVRTDVNGSQAGPPLDLYGPFAPGEPTPLGEFEFDAGEIRIRSQVVDKNPKSAGYFFGVDCFILEPLD